MTVTKTPTPPFSHNSAEKTANATLVALNSDSKAGLASAEAKSRLADQGANEVPEKSRHPLWNFAKKFWGLSAWMIELIALLSLFLHKYTDLWVALSLLLVNAVLSLLQEQRSSSAVNLLRHRLQITARVLRNGNWGACGARELVCGDIVRIRAGDFVPADVQIIDGALEVDQSALTGESHEVHKANDDTLYSSTIVHEGEATAVVVATGVRTYFGRTAELVQTAQSKLHVEEVISRVVRWLLLIVGTLVAITIVMSLIEGLRLLDILPLSLVLLMSAIPVALPVMFTVSMAVGSLALARKGVLVTHLNAAEDAANLDVLCADKTGTLTFNRLTFVRALPQPGFTEDDVIRDGALASSQANADPIDLAFLQAAREHKIPISEKILSFTPFSAKTRRTEAIAEFGAKQMRLTKGALRTIAGAAGLDETAMAALEARADKEAQSGFRALAVARADGNGPLRLVGLALLQDSPRPDSKQLIKELQSLGVVVKMLTGDALPIAQEIARELGLGEISRAPDLRAAKSASGQRASALAVNANGFAEVFPEDKFLIVKSLQEAGHVVGMTGDGVNDAPALRQAEVGIAVSGATDVAKGAASIVLTTEGLGGIVDLIKNGRAIYQRVLTWIINKISRTILKAGFVVVAFLFTGKFVISALGMVLLVFMTDFVKIALSTDNVRPSQKPETWNIIPLVRVGAILGALMLIEALGILAFDWNRFGLASNSGAMQTFTFQTLLFFAIFSIISIRERRAFWASRPSRILALALVADALVGISIGQFGLAELRPLPISQTATIFTYALICSLGINDQVKLLFLGRSHGKMLETISM